MDRLRRGSVVFNPFPASERPAWLEPEPNFANSGQGRPKAHKFGPQSTSSGRVCPTLVEELSTPRRLCSMLVEFRLGIAQCGAALADFAPILSQA